MAGRAGVGSPDRSPQVTPLSLPLGGRHWRPGDRPACWWRRPHRFARSGL